MVKYGSPSCLGTNFTLFTNGNKLPKIHNMLSQRIPILFLFCFFLFKLTAQEHHQRLSEMDVLHYRFQLELNDQNDVIQGKARVDISFLEPLSVFHLDLVGKQTDTEKGMTVTEVLLGEEQLSFDHTGDELTIHLNEAIGKGATGSFVISYYGIPADGLIISESKYGDRTFFGDNWPNRARHWLPTVDHPSDKATVEFVVTAPDHYQVVANGEQIEETNRTEDTKLTHWKMKVPLPTKVMVIGVARFAVNHVGYVDCIPVSSWVYRQDRDAGFEDYKIALKVLDFFYKKMGSYPYEKLANVQSKTRYGGMENAGNIFYFENSVNGDLDLEGLIAHEIAHQWFGNSASEANWHHIWLSEGFATYLTDIYVEETRGLEASLERLKAERQQVIQFAHRRPAPLIDVSVKDYNRLLNANSYQKGAWVLHMLRHEIGDAVFWRGIRAYYKKYALSNALSEDFQEVMEEISGKNLDKFFQQWLYQPGHPVLKIKSRKVSRRKAEITIRQVQDYIFDFTLELEVVDETGQKHRKKIDIHSREHTFKMKLKGELDRVIIDPEVRLLYEEGE